jgi:hypothetical protein
LPPVIPDQPVSVAPQIPEEAPIQTTTQAPVLPPAAPTVPEPAVEVEVTTYHPEPAPAVNYDDSVVVEAAARSNTNEPSNKQEELSVIPVQKEVEQLPTRGDIAVEREEKSAPLVEARSSPLNANANNEIVIQFRLTPEQARQNQEKFLELLSERNGFAEIATGKNQEHSSEIINSFIRSRVISATPAPIDAKEHTRTVNIRRIVVSSPVETVRDVEVSDYNGHGTEKTNADDVQQPPVYSTSTPPAFAEGSSADDSKKKKKK